MKYEDREKLKERGWDLLRDSDPPKTKRLVYLECIIQAHYWRAKEAIEICKTPKKFLKKIRGKEYDKEYELDLDHYTEHWLYANKHLMDKEIFKLCREWYDPKESKYLPKGCTIYQFLEE
jgi:hypothetical protein